ncbi:class I SAM-dependent methyltransferase [Mycobacterium sp. MYCO198283]|uniref:HemK2/MTQ2 family protein methyltransferase n=1 Tax=Mycobacterium sp. MYCO198283 TaxID=2883505 RepID=UPI001E5D87ED|nr:HemK2/MTQ2 family protein methyltransferase [Mycobacterium sp. MYCO198283]MCG5432833.1 class I SAM-dependent methyltransferase [Mycobacterium sp. MYCO198283]
MTLAYPDVCKAIVADRGVYAPQDDSHLMVDVLERTGLAAGRRVLDLCTGSGVLAVAAATFGAASVTAFDICSRAVQCAQSNAQRQGVGVDVRLGSLEEALCLEPFDLVISNPPYVPVTPHSAVEEIPAEVGPTRAWDAGDDGRMVLDPLCKAAGDLLAPGGTVLIVHSEFSDTDATLEALTASGLKTSLAATRFVPFGPVMEARAEWLESQGRLEPGRREEELVVVRGDKR